jgi:RNA polymerase sigma-70 factor (ECF subfamily)
MATDRQHGYYPTTNWSEIERAGHSDSPAARQVLNGLLERYYPPLQAELMRSFGATEHQALDWLQSFAWKKIVLKNLFANANRSRGRFRTFVISALLNFVKDELEHAGRQRRSASGGEVSMEEMGEAEPAAKEEAPGARMDLAWARGVLAQTIELVQAECERKGDHRGWEVFRLRLLEPALEGAHKRAYKALYAQLGFRSDAEAGNALITAKRRFMRSLRSVVGVYCRKEQEIDAEIRELMAIFSAN